MLKFSQVVRIVQIELFSSVQITSFKPDKHEITCYLTQNCLVFSCYIFINGNFFSFYSISDQYQILNLNEACRTNIFKLYFCSLTIYCPVELCREIDWSLVLWISFGLSSFCFFCIPLDRLKSCPLALNFLKFSAIFRSGVALFDWAKFAPWAPCRSTGQ